MTPQQIADELSPRLRGRVSVDDITRRLYSTDASPFQIVPAAVFVPLDEDDLIAAVKLADEYSIAIVPRGAGTGLAGESLNSGIVIDLSIHFRRVLEIGGDWVRVQPGVTLRELNDALAPHDRRFAPDPSNAEVVTLGGMIATNASGGTAFRHGLTSDHVRALRVVMANGDISSFGAGSVSDGVEDRLKDLQATYATTISESATRAPLRQCGYRLGGDLVKLLVGSEGTLAITTEATLATVPLVGGVARYALGYHSLDDAIAAGLRLRTHVGIAGCDLLDQRLLSLARTAKGVIDVPADVVAALVVMLEGGDDASALAQASFDALRTSEVVVLAEPASDAEGCGRIARFRTAAVYGFYSLPGIKRPEAFVEDIGVPLESLTAFFHGAQQLLRDADVTASFLAHLLTGVVHCRPILDLTDRADQAKAWPLAGQLHDLAISLGGTISAQHGVGLARTPWIEKQFGPLLPVFREVKRLFDPKNILNPGKIVGPDPSRPAWPLRSGQGSGVGGQLKTENSLPIVAGFESEVKKCNACGDCRVRSTPSRMCPVFRVSGEEAATPRAKANVLRAVLDEPERLSGDDVKEVAKLCIQCTRCRSECPAGIDIPSLMLEAKAAHYAAHGYDRGEWLIARSDRLAALAGTFAFTANMILAWRPTRWLLEKVIGLSRRRMLHRFTHRTFLRRRLVQSLFRREVAGTSRKFVYFVDTFANVNDPLIAEATVAVLEHHGFTVAVPQKQRASGMAALSMGLVESARRTAAYNVRTLAEWVRDGYTVVCSEPTATLAITTEYPRLLKDADSTLVAANTVELSSLLAELQTQGALKPPTRELDLRVAHHVPCHLKTLGEVNTPTLLSAIPKLAVSPIDVGCSGSAGPWGLAKVNFDLSMQIGAPVFRAIEDASATLGATECSTCRMQIQQGTGRRVLHPVQLLAMSYGLVPQLERRFTRPLRERLTG